MTAGKDIMEDAKITGITPAVLTFSGILVDWPPISFLPTIFLEYWTGILLSAPLRISTRTTTRRITAAMISPARVPFAIVFPLIKFSYSNVRSLGTLEMILMVSTMEIPFPTPFSVIRSPSHISIAEPAVRQATTTTPLKKSRFGIIPWRPNPIAIAIDSNKARPTVT